ncbi:membrane protein insertion efficiency factor YidD [Candidatus Falkowbacteria bacterium]|nr:membrane protein insertion efficiency factor YidD [Candidatus Falkowbacteria bacterium]
MIEIYQRTLSFDHGPFKYLFPGGYCKFRPTCSEYAHQAIAKYGLWRGGFKGLWRIMRCNPWSKGGNDPVD